MTKEQKELLWIDIFPRILHGVKFRFEVDKDTYKTKCFLSSDGLPSFDELWSYWMGEGYLLPYLRPMSSMTEEEWKEFEEIFGFPIGAGYNTVTKKLNVYNYVVIDKGYGVDIWFDDIANILNWLNTHHFDYRGLIEKGLAIAVTEENNPYK